MLSLTQRSLLFISFLLVSMVLLSCDKVGNKESATSDETAWSDVIHSYTSGSISKTSKIRVRFVHDIINDEKVNTDASGSLSFTPEIKGKLVFANKREIILLPDSELESGQQYQAVLNTSKLANIPSNLDTFKFNFSVIKQNFEINILGLSSNLDDDNLQELHGSLVTADKEDTAKIEQIISARYRGQALEVNWQHNADGLHHEFTVKGILRQSESSKLVLNWDGKVINVVSTGQREVEVIAKGIFNVTHVRSVQSDRQYVQLEFSDKLKQNQNLKGLVRLKEGTFTTRVDNNTIKIYPDKPLQGEITVMVDVGIKNEKGQRLTQKSEYKVSFTREKPMVRFSGKGVILPENQFLTIPFEAVNVDSVQVTAFRVYDDNIGQFLQSNKLEGENEIQRVGRHLWRKTIKLKDAKPDEWNRYSLDATSLLKQHPGGLFRLTLSINRGNSTFSCSADEQAVAVPKDKPLANHEDLNVTENSSWEYAETYYGQSQRVDWYERNNPCKDSYFTYSDGVKVSRNFMASNLGLIAKRDDTGNLYVTATDLSTSLPLGGVQIRVMNFQGQQIGEVETDNNGMAKVSLATTPFYMEANKGKQKGYLKLSKGTALPISHFDVGGEKVKKGVKGRLYGERGVWRPGDDIFLTFVLQDKQNTIPDNHPVTLQLYNPKGQLMQSVTNAEPVGDFYAFKLKTKDDDLTGNWTARAILGGATFTKKLKIETVVPNRLKVELDFGKDSLSVSDMPIKTTLFGQWLHGATASQLKTDVAVRLHSIKTRFGRFQDFIFDDPTREFRSERQVIFEGTLDKEGYASFNTELQPGSQAPGMLSAAFSSRVFEQGGAFSTSSRSLKFSPYENYVGIKLPKGDPSRGMLLTDTEHTVEIGTLDTNGEPASLKKVQVTLYKINWKWWWDKSGESLAQYASATHHSKLQQGTIETKDGKGRWTFEIKYPDWGRYLVRACDLQGQHCSGKLVYIDWPGWAGRAQEQSGPGASTLNFFADKPRYKVGEVAKIQLPDATQGRALVSIETGSHIIEQHWVEFNKDNTRFEIPLTRAMSPNVYVHVTLIQPHQGKKNDRPIRLYGIVPILVDDPETELSPVLTAADEWAPKSEVEFSVAEKNGKAMTYTVAIVDEGLLGLTNFKTPNLHKHFYKKEALGVTTWDLFDSVTGAYGGELERLLALGGGDGGEDKEGKEKKRFPPVVKFFGPFKLEAGENKTHKFKLPQYVGAVRVMVVAGEQSAYGLADKSVFVREDLSLLATVPRVLGPDEELVIPVSLFVMKPEIKKVTLKLETDDHFEMIGDNSVDIIFDEPGEQLGLLHLKVKGSLGKGQLKFTANAGKVKTESKIYIDIRSPNPPTQRQWNKVLQAGESWQQEIKPFGLKGTNKISLEVSAVPPINLQGRLQYLIRYPHGCVEQVTSSVFPQLYLTKLIKLQDEQKNKIQHNVHAAIDRLRGYQHMDGGFIYWPGYGSAHGWATNYAGHFLTEANKLGFQVPADMLSKWQLHQQKRARAWVTGGDASALDQAYRLYTLALAGKAELGAMNRLREHSSMSNAARWQLAAAYALAGLHDVAEELVANADLDVGTSIEPHTFGSRLRNQAVLLNSLVILKANEDAAKIAEQISKDLSADKWHSTQTVAYSLLAMSRYIGGGDAGEAFSFEQLIGSGAARPVKAEQPIHREVLKMFPDEGENIKLNNTAEKTLYATIIAEGVPRAGEEQASHKDLAMEVEYKDLDGNSIEVDKMTQGSDFVVDVSISNHTQAKIDNIALTQILPSGWEIHNSRMDAEQNNNNAAFDYQDTRDDRVYTYFELKPGETKTFRTLLNATYLGQYYLPGVSVEAMYNAAQHARVKGHKVEVYKKR